MKLSSIRDFVAVAERGSLRAASRHTGVPQPSMTRSIRELERELGTDLLERTAQGVQLTPMGQAFLRRASTVCNELEKASGEISQMCGNGRGTITVALSSVPHLALLPHALRSFYARFPNVRMHVIDAVFPCIESDLRAGAIDLYVGPAPEKLTPDLRQEKLFDNSRMIVGRKGHPLAKATSLTELSEAEWVTTSITAKEEEELGPLFRQHGLPPPRLVLRAESALTFLIAMVYSDLLMMLPVQWLEFPLWRDAIEAIPVREVLPAPPICIVQRQGLPLTPAAEHFCDLIHRAVAYMAEPALPRR